MHAHPVASTQTLSCHSLASQAPGLSGVEGSPGELVHAAVLGRASLALQGDAECAPLMVDARLQAALGQVGWAWGEGVGGEQGLPRGVRSVVNPQWLPPCS